MKELAKYLHHRNHVLLKYARSRGILHWASLGPGHSPAPYVTEEGAMRIIAHVRVIQGGFYVRGKDFHALREAQAAEIARRRARLREKVESEQTALNVREQLAVAIPRAGTEDDSRGVRAAGGIVIAETAVVSTQF